VCIDGEGTEKMEISGFRDLPRIETNQVRGGACLVIAEGLCQKAAKIKKHVDKLKLEGWDFISEYLKSKNTSTNGENVTKSVVPSDKYLKDIVAGRPIFSHPSRVGGFRLRYGRGRTCGLAALAFSPASMYVLDEFPALGTQIKIERPGKACVVTPCDELDGPIVLLKNGDLVQCNTKEEATEVRSSIVEIIDCGEVLVPFGEFCENNHFLIPCGYPIEWHKQELLRKGDLPKDWRDPTWERAKQMSRELGVPLHPNFNLFWSDMDVGSLDRLRMQILKNGTFIDSELHLLKDETSKKTLEDLGVLHTVQNDTLVIRRYALPLIEGLGLTVEGEKLLSVTEFSGESALEAVSRAMGLKVYARASTRIGMRMARPEKAKDRKGAPVIHGLFPVSDNPKYKKEVITAIHTIKQSPSYPTTHKVNVSVEAGKRVCPKCKKETYRAWCRDCCVHTEFITAGSGFERNNEIVELNDEYQAAMKTLELNSVPEVKVVDRLISKIKVPEALEKAILRAKYDLGTYKDGTIRFDMTDIPITHFRPREIELTVEKAIALGYTHDMDGNPLTSDEQLCELKVQDIIPNSGCGDYLVIVAAYVDHLLEKFYECDRFYNIENRQELIGHLGVGLAPHTSGGILCRIIGYTSANGCYAHPFFHAAKRRNCDGDEDSVILLLDCLINFSRAYLPDRRGGLMDAPLVLTTRLDPNEIDKEAHNIDCLREYPLEFYEAAMSFKDTKEIEKSMDLIAGRIGTPQQYEGLGFTHDTADISEGPKHSAYTTLETMMDKMEAQLYLGKKIRAVDEKDVATRVINKHFLPDMAGNLRSFSTQGVRCNVCGAKYRRIPLTGKCTAPNASKPGGRCNNPLVLSVYEASVKKYLAISQEIGRKYELSDYTKERIDILEMSMDSLFNNDKVKKCKLSDFF
ncbi:MAG: DNA polymerase II large subunit, partial [Candidatus Methanomethylophilaceae archaeon]